MVDSTNNRKRKDVTGRGRCNKRGVLDTIGCAEEKTKDLRILYYCQFGDLEIYNCEITKYIII